MSDNEDRKKLEQLFSQTLANYGVCIFNINALQKQSEFMFAELEGMKSQLEALKNNE